MGEKKPVYWIDVAAVNRGQLKAFKVVPFCKRLLLLPHCMQQELIDKISKFAIELGYHVLVAAGGTDVENYIRDHQPGAVVGIACMKEIYLADMYLDIPYQAIQLATFGCTKHNSTFNLEEAKEILALCST